MRTSFGERLLDLAVSGFLWGFRILIVSALWYWVRLPRSALENTRASNGLISSSLVFHREVFML